jgi:hypothetical protein
MILCMNRPRSPKPVAVPVRAPPPVPRVPKPKCDETSRQDAVRCWRDSGKAAHVVAAEIGVTDERFYGWNSQFPSLVVQAAQGAPLKSPSNAGLRSQLDAAFALHKEGSHVTQWGNGRG